MRLITTLLTAAVCCTTATVSADIFTLEGGGQVVGKLVNPKEVPRKTYIIETSSGIQLELDRQDVADVEHQRPAEEEYARIAPQYPDTADAQWKLAEWCREHTLRQQREKHLRRVIELDPEREEAWRALHYSRVDGKWMTQEEVMKSRGYVRYKNRWRLPQEVRLIEERRKRELAEREWYRKLKMYQKWLEDPDRWYQAVERIKEIDDPYALPAIQHNLQEEPNPNLRLLYIESLTGIDSPAAHEILVEQSLVDPNTEVRLTALENLAKTKSPAVVNKFVRYLGSKNNAVINRAAVGLLAMGNEKAVGPLIESLISQHKYKVTIGNPGGGIGMTFAQPNGSAGPNPGGFPSVGGSSGGLAGMSMGSKTKIITRYVANESVLEALVSLTDGPNFGYDVAAWRRWYAAKQTPASLDARRD